MERSINTSGEFYLADFGYLSMSVYNIHDLQAGGGDRTGI
jgi:hypothetical protein